MTPYGLLFFNAAQFALGDEPALAPYGTQAAAAHDFFTKAAQ
jgi:hypothetical protein